MKNLFPSYVRVPVVFFIIFGLVEYFVDSGEQPAFLEYPAIMLFLTLVLLILIALEAIVGSLENVMMQSLDAEAKKRYIESKNKVPEFTWFKKMYKKLTGSKPIEKEGEIILDHNYDGIRELDNSLPPWWVYGFYATIVFAVIYLFRYQVLDAENQFEELETEYAEAQIAIDEYKRTAKDLVDINTVELLTEAADLNSGKKIFETNCVACHMADGGGGIGPNLTDKYWILGGGIKNIFRTISEGGRDGKGMISWRQSLKPSEMAQVGSYLLQFQGTTPAKPKAAEGDLWVDEVSSDTKSIPETNEQVIDSTKVDSN